VTVFADMATFPTIVLVFVEVEAAALASGVVVVTAFTFSIIA
jgi:hypothetical protein